LEQERAKTGRVWLGAVCVLTLVCVCVSPAKVFAQTSAPSDADSSKKTSDTKSKTQPASHPAASKRATSKTSTVARNSKAKRTSARGKKKTARGQQKIDPERAQAIQEALIREHYLSGEAAGTWNQASEDAMRKYQADHGWQSKTVPDSRALISLGLGPSHDHLLNPESAMTTGPDASHTASANTPSQNPASHSADPGTRVNTTRTLPVDPPPAATSPSHDGASPQ
jgi:hypothetical protein